MVEAGSLKTFVKYFGIFLYNRLGYVDTDLWNILDVFLLMI